jgi:SPP1 family predicted phage head-tail adaptor
MERLNIGINPGRLRHTITLLEPQTTVGVSGVETTFAPGSPPVTALAEIKYVRGVDVIKSGQVVSQTYLTVTIRYNPAFTAGKRIQKYDGKQYIIQAVENVREMNAYMVLTCLGLGLNN